MKETDFASMLPPLLLGDELTTALTRLPEYTPAIRELPASQRLQRLADIYRVFVPTSMATEIYQRLYLMTSMSLRNKGSVDSNRQLNACYTWSHGGEYRGVITGATSATIIGSSGIGKTSCIQLAVNLLGPIIDANENLHRVVPVIMVSCPFDCSYKGLLYQILLSIDETLGTDYYMKSQRSNMNSQQILGMVCQVCHLSVGLLIIDEIQLLAGATKAGTILYRMILQLINTACINVLLVGTCECLAFFGQTQQIARRSVGLQYSPLEYGPDFTHIAEILYRYQYTRMESPLTENIVAWLYEHTAGIPATLISLIHDAQEVAIIKGRESLCLETLTEAYSSHMKMLHNYIVPGQTSKFQTGNFHETSSRYPDMESKPETSTLPQGYRTILDMAQEARSHQVDIIPLFRQQFSITEVNP